MWGLGAGGWEGVNHMAKGATGEKNRDLDLSGFQKLWYLRTSISILPMDLKSSRKPTEYFN